MREHYLKLFPIIVCEPKMKKNILLISLLISNQALSKIPDFNISSIADVDTISKVTMNSDETKFYMLTQTNDAIYATNNAKVFLSENKGDIPFSEFADTYISIIELGKLYKFRRGVQENGSKSVLLTALSKVKKPEFECKLSSKDYSSSREDGFKKIDIDCKSSIYGKNHWLEQNQRITDTYYLTIHNGEWNLSGFEFGLIKTYIESINSKISNIKKTINEQTI